jgi:hypothetical protein
MGVNDCVFRLGDGMAGTPKGDVVPSWRGLWIGHGVLVLLSQKGESESRGSRRWRLR